MTGLVFTREHPWFAGTGRGVKVAVIDSGIHNANPHITSPVSGIHISEDAEDDDVVDRLGHGTAVSAAILEKAPDSELFAIRVFDRTLATGAVILARAIERAADHECRLINLSLGTANLDREALLLGAVQYAAARGAIVVSAYQLNDTKWLPGSLRDVVGVLLDPDCDRHEIRIQPFDGGRVFRASGYPRPIPGVPPERNLQGISFAVANLTGMLARLLERHPEPRSSSEVFDLLSKA